MIFPVHAEITEQETLRSAVIKQIYLYEQDIKNHKNWTKIIQKIESFLLLHKWKKPILEKLSNRIDTLLDTGRYSENTLTGKVLFYLHLQIVKTLYDEYKTEI